MIKNIAIAILTFLSVTTAAYAEEICTHYLKVSDSFEGVVISNKASDMKDADVTFPCMEQFLKVVDGAMLFDNKIAAMLDLELDAGDSNEIIDQLFSIQPGVMMSLIFDDNKVYVKAYSRNYEAL